MLLKLAAARGFSFAELFQGTVSASAAYAFAAALLFGANFCFYLFALSDIPLSVAYPIMIGMTFLITVAVSVLMGERIGLIHTLGMILILSGIFLTVWFAGR